MTGGYEDYAPDPKIITKFVETLLEGQRLLDKYHGEKKMKPRVTLMNVTEEALNMLILAKGTRLDMKPERMDEIRAMSEEEKMKEVEYIANTIPASWEFVDFTFLVCDVTRGYTHQQVRTRNASYAQQTMRLNDMSKDFKYGTGPTVEDNIVANRAYKLCMNQIKDAYSFLIEIGCKVEDARGLLPTNIGTNILVKMNLRTLADVCRKRSSSRVQDEYREVVRQMKEEAIAKLPWVSFFIDRTFDKAAYELDKMIMDIPNSYIGYDYKLKMVKLLDQMRMQS